MKRLAAKLPKRLLLESWLARNVRSMRRANVRKRRR